MPLYNLPTISLTVISSYCQSSSYQHKEKLGVKVVKMTDQIWFILHPHPTPMNYKQLTHVMWLKSNTKCTMMWSNSIHQNTDC